MTYEEEEQAAKEAADKKRWEKRDRLERVFPVAAAIFALRTQSGGGGEDHTIKKADQAIVDAKIFVNKFCDLMNELK